MIREPYPPLTIVTTHNGSTRENDTLTGIISHSSPIYGNPEEHRYTVMIPAGVWNATGRRTTNRTETLDFYSDEVTPAGDDIDIHEKVKLTAAMLHNMEATSQPGEPKE